MATLMTRPTAPLRFSVNGAPVELEASGGRRLLDALRYDLGLTGTKEGCGEGECGACSVLVDGAVVLSCLIPVVQAAGCDIRTVEGLALDGRLDPLQEAFLETGAAQCGMCTPGMLMAARALLDSGEPPTEHAIREAIAGNLCRCTGYTKILEAIALASRLGPTDRGRSAAGPTRRAVAPPSAGPVVLTPRSLDDALESLAGPDAPQPIAGGTDLMVAVAAGTLLKGERFIDIRGLDELRGIAVEGDHMSLGALTTYTDLRRSPVIASALPVLAEAAATIGAIQIQNRGTIGGNIVNASPAGDMLPVLLATDASLSWSAGAVRGSSPRTRSGPAIAGLRGRPMRLLTRIGIPLVPGRQVRYRKVGTRRAQAISKVVMAVAWRDDGIAWRDVRIGLGSVAERPIRARETEAVLEGGRPIPGTAERAAATIEAEIHPIDDVRSTAAYRRAVTGRILSRIILDAADE